MKNEQITKHFASLKTGRSNFENIWEQVAERTLPNYVGFTGSKAKGEEKGLKIFDTTAPIAMDRLVGILQTIVVPASQKFHFLKSKSYKLNQKKNIREFYQLLNDQLFAIRENPKSNFRINLQKTLYSFVAFGNGILFVEDKKPGLRYKNIPLQEVFWDENADGGIDTIFRCFKFTVKQIALEFGENSLPEDLKRKYTDNPCDEQEYEILHCVKPRENVDKNKKDYTGMEYASYYVLKENGEIIKESGYTTFPYIVLRWTVIPGEKYGRSPAMTLLPEIKTLNEMDRVNLDASQMTVRPPLLASEDGVFNEFKMIPGSILFGGLDPQGNKRLEALNTSGNIQISEDMQERRRNNIKDALFTNIFNILQENPRATATEIVERAKEKGELLSPVAAIIQTELLAPMVDREVDILFRNGAVGKVPEDLEKDGDYDIVYDSPISQMMKARDVSAIMNTINILAPMANINPAVFDYLDLAEIGKFTALNSGVNESVIKTEDDVKADKAAQQQAQQNQQAMVEAEALKNTASASKDIATAQSMGE